jgi:hypothetical protein
MARFLETWTRQDEFWAEPSYHFNWKMMCCGESGMGALACRDDVPELRAVLEGSLADCLMSSIMFLRRETGRRVRPTG